MCSSNPPYSKKEVYERIIADFGIDYHEVLVVGDSTNLDLRSANDISEKIRTQLVTDSNSICKILKKELGN
jgi:histidinol phosphatase-like enzyme